MERLRRLKFPQLSDFLTQLPRSSTRRGEHCEPACRSRTTSVNPHKTPKLSLRTSNRCHWCGNLIVRFTGVVRDQQAGSQCSPLRVEERGSGVEKSDD